MHSLDPNFGIAGNRIPAKFYSDLNSYLSSDSRSYSALKLTCKAIQAYSEEWEKTKYPQTIFKIARCLNQKRVCDDIVDSMRKKPRIWLPLTGVELSEKGYRNKALIWIAEKLILNKSSRSACGMIGRFKEDSSNLSVSSQKNIGYAHLTKAFLEENNLHLAHKCLAKISPCVARKYLSLQMAKKTIYENHPRKDQTVLWLVDSAISVIRYMDSLGLLTEARINSHLETVLEIDDSLEPSPLKDQVKTRIINAYCFRRHFDKGRMLAMTIDSSETKQDIYLKIIQMIGSEIINDNNALDHLRHIKEILSELKKLSDTAGYFDEKIQNLIISLSSSLTQQVTIKEQIATLVDFIDSPLEKDKTIAQIAWTCLIFGRTELGDKLIEKMESAKLKEPLLLHIEQIESFS